MNVICKYCNKTFHIRPSFYKKNKTKIFYCCKDHMLKDKHVDKKEIKCSTCGKSIIKRITEIGLTNFCNKECLLKYKKKITLICKECGEKFEVDESYYRKQEKRNQTPVYCSTNCRINHQRKDKIEINCKVCNKPFYINKNKVSENENCCSIECRKILIDNSKIECKCDYCNKDLILNKFPYERNKTHFCNQECFDLYRAAKKEKYSEVAHYLRCSKEYEIWRSECLKRDYYKCTKCESKKNLHIHHSNLTLYDICEIYNMDIKKIILSNEFNDLTNGITLCSDCHLLEHPFIQRDEYGRFVSRSKTKLQKS